MADLNPSEQYAKNVATTLLDHHLTDIDDWRAAAVPPESLSWTRSMVFEADIEGLRIVATRGTYRASGGDGSPYAELSVYDADDRLLGHMRTYAKDSVVTRCATAIATAYEARVAPARPKALAKLRALTLE